MAMIQVKTKGMKAVLARIDAVRKTPAFDILIKNKGTSGSIYKPVKGKSRSGKRQTFKFGLPPRSAGKNTVILRTQAKAGRNVIFIKATEKKPLIRLIRNAFAEIIGKHTHKALRPAVDIVAKRVVEIYQSHILLNQGPKGKLKPNKPSTIDKKLRDRSSGAVDKSLRSQLTPLRHTDQLLRSFEHEVKEV